MLSRHVIPCLLVAIVLPLIFFGCGRGEVTYVTIGTGSQTGVYYPTGEAIARMVNAKGDEYKVQASFESTGGSVFNVNAILAGDMEFGIVQSDLQYQAARGEGPWEGQGPQDSLRAVFSIHPELVTLVAAEDSGIRTLRDLRGKRVNLDSPGSGTLQNALMVLAAVGIDAEKDLSVERVSAKEGPSLLQDGRIDAFFFTVAHPSGALLEATAGTRGIRFIPIEGPEIDAILDAAPYMTRAHIPLSLYPKSANDAEVPTIGVKATLMTSSHVPEAIVHAITKEVFENLATFKKLHQAYGQLTRENMLDALSAPLHDGARRYFLEAGLLREGGED